MQMSQFKMLDIDQLLIGRITDMEKAIVFMKIPQKEQNRKRKRVGKSKRVVDNNIETCPVDAKK